MANNNHLAGYLAMVLLIGWGVLWFTNVKKIIKLCLFLCLISGLAVLIFLTNSRAGLIAFFLSFLILIYMKSKKLYILGLVTFPVVLICFFYFSNVGSGFKKGDPYAYERLIIWEDSIELFSDYPLLGSGLGTFRSYYPRYKRMEGLRTTQYAHNEYLNLLVEMGLIGFVLFLWVMIRLFRGVVPRRFLYPGFFAALCSVFIQAGVEFNLHNVAITFPLCFLLGITLPKKEYKFSGLANVSYLVKIPIWLGFIFLIFLFSLPHLGSHFYKRGQRFFEKGNLIKAQENISRGITFDPVCGLYHIRLGEIYWKRGLSLKALDEFKIAVGLESRNVWYKRTLAQKYLELNTLDKSIEEYKQIIELAPNVSLFHDELNRLYKLKLDKKNIKPKICH